MFPCGCYWFVPAHLLYFSKLPMFLRHPVLRSMSWINSIVCHLLYFSKMPMFLCHPVLRSMSWINAIVQTDAPILLNRARNSKMSMEMFDAIAIRRNFAVIVSSMMMMSIGASFDHPSLFLTHSLLSWSIHVGPTCEELLIYPGSVLAGCENVCDDVVSVDDYVRFAGTITNFNLDKTHLVVSCSCNGQELCNDEIEFSDRVELDQCTPILRRRVRCMNFCSSFEPLFTGGNYTSTDGYATCSCNSEEGEAIKCADQVPTSSGPYHRSATLTFGTLFAALFLASVV